MKERALIHAATPLSYAAAFTLPPFFASLSFLITLR